MDLSALPVLDKSSLIGAGCTRLSLRVDAAQVQAEVARLPADLWGTQGGRGGVHDRAETVWLKGNAPATRIPGFDEKPVFARLPQLRELVLQRMQAEPLRCLLARLPAGCHVPAHADAGVYFQRSLRFHVAVTSSPQVVMYADGCCYHMQPGEVWALDNSSVHGVLNDDLAAARTHLIVDYLPSPALLELLQTAERDLGVRDATVDRRFELMFEQNAAARS
jgi:hypothetical protein